MEEETFSRVVLFFFSLVPPSRRMKVCGLFFYTAADAVTPAAEKVGRHKYLHWWVNTRRCMAFFTVRFGGARRVGDLVVCLSVCLFVRDPLLTSDANTVLGSALLQHRRHSSAVLLSGKSSSWRLGDNNWPPSRASLLLLLLLLLDILFKPSFHPIIMNSLNSAHNIEKILSFSSILFF